MQLIEDKQSIIALAEKHGLHLQDEVEINEVGLDFRVVFAIDKAETAWILRIPRREDVLTKARQEFRTLELVKPRLPVEVPDWKINTAELIAYPRLNGKPAVAVDKAFGEPVWQIDRESPNFDRTFAETLAALHGIDTQAAADAGLKAKTVEQIRQSVAEDIRLVNAEIGIKRELFNRWQSWLETDALWDFQPSLIHGDIHQAHLLVDEDSRITGVLDWTEAEIGDPSMDFIFHQFAFGDEALKQLIADYEQAGGKTWREMFAHVTEQLAAFPLKVALYALTSGQPEMMEIAKTQLGVEPTVERSL